MEHSACNSNAEEQMCILCASEALQTGAIIHLHLSSAVT